MGISPGSTSLLALCLCCWARFLCCCNSVCQCRTCLLQWWRARLPLCWPRSPLSPQGLPSPSQILAMLEEHFDEPGAAICAHVSTDLRAHITKVGGAADCLEAVVAAAINPAVPRGEVKTLTIRALLPNASCLCVRVALREMSDKSQSPLRPPIARPATAAESPACRF